MRVTQQEPKVAGIPQMVGLFVFVATAAIFLGALTNTVRAGLQTQQQFAMAFSYLVGTLAVVVMFVDVYDLWVRGRRLSRGASRGLRMIALVAILGSMAATVLGRDLSLVIFLMPAVIIYYLTMRPRAATTRGARSGRRPAPTASAPKSRQRRGGRKRR